MRLRYAMGLRDAAKIRYGAEGRAFKVKKIHNFRSRNIFKDINRNGKIAINERTAKKIIIP